MTISSGPATAPSVIPAPPPLVVAEDRLTEQAEERNLLMLAAYTVMLRLAWVFKTESVVIPAFLQAISGQPWMQGWLPMLNRFGQSLPPLFFADRLRDMPRKSVSLVRTTGAMGGVFLILAGLLSLADHPTLWWPTVFLLLYAVFFVATGLNALAFNTLQGKLIAPHRRGRLMSRGGIVGSAAAVAAAWFVLHAWRATEVASFILPFTVTGVGMLVAATLLAAVREPADLRTRRPRRDAGQGRLSRLLAPFRETRKVLRADPRFRRLVVCAMAFVTSQLIFPHYVPLAQAAFPTGAIRLVTFLIVQNVGVGLFSVLLGWIADRRGNRLALRIALTVCAATPLLAVAFTTGLLPGGAGYFWTTFFVLGMQPVTFKTFTNYTLELTEPARHPRYLSTLTICMATPFLLALPVGWLVGRLGPTPVFVAVASLIAAGALLTFRLAEPREH